MRTLTFSTQGLEKLVDNFPTPPFGRLSHLPRTILGYIQSYLLSLHNVLEFGLFNSTVVALIYHKLMIIDLHQPLSGWGLCFAGPCLFVFDLMTAMVLHLGLASSSVALKGLAGIGCTLIILLSATFASLYLEGNAELNWSRSVGVIPFSDLSDIQVISDWKFFKGLMSQGNGCFGRVFVLYLLAGISAVAIRLCLMYYQRPLIPTTREVPKTSRKGVGSLRQFLVTPCFSLFFILLLGTMFLPPTPWKHLTSTLPYDVVYALSEVMLASTQIRDNHCSKEPVIGTNPLGTLRYNPADDPYYISNLQEPVDSFIASALEGIKFTNIVHITLESMREDSYPFQEDGLLNQHIRKNLKPVKNGVPVTTETVTPFIASLGEHTISWHTLWSTIPYTHKAMLACISPRVLPC